MLKTRPTRGLLSHQASFKYHTCTFHLFFSLCDHGLIMWYTLAVSWSTKKKKRKCLFRFTCQKTTCTYTVDHCLYFILASHGSVLSSAIKNVIWQKKKKDFYVTQLIKPIVFLLSWVKSTRSHMHKHKFSSKNPRWG